MVGKLEQRKLPLVVAIKTVNALPVYLYIFLTEHSRALITAFQVFKYLGW